MFYIHNLSLSIVITIESISNDRWDIYRTCMHARSTVPQRPKYWYRWLHISFFFFFLCFFMFLCKSMKSQFCVVLCYLHYSFLCLLSVKQSRRRYAANIVQVQHSLVAFMVRSSQSLMNVYQLGSSKTRGPQIYSCRLN